MALHLQSRKVDLGGGFTVRRALPQRALRKVGPWVFVDHFGPAEGLVQSTHDVRPHPHSGLSTVSYLFEGATEHRDSTGGHAIVRPGEIHWMRGGHGIVHSERAPKDRLGTVQRSHGLQLWCAHPDGEEEQEPRFDSWTDLPELDLEGVRVRLLAGHGWGLRSPVETTSPLIYAIAELRPGQRLELPDHAERSIYMVRGAAAVDGERCGEHEMLVLERPSTHVVALSEASVVVLGGDPIGERIMWWNLVHSDRARLKEQAQRWREGRFPSIPGDDQDFIPAPEFGP